VPQLLARPELVEALDAVCGATGARFVEVVLTAEPADLVDRLAARVTALGSGADADPWSALEGPPTVDRVRELAERVDALVATRPGTHRVVSVPGDVDATLARLVAAVEATG